MVTVVQKIQLVEYQIAVMLNGMELAKEDVVEDVNIATVLHGNKKNPRLRVFFINLRNNFLDILSSHQY